MGKNFIVRIEWVDHRVKANSMIEIIEWTRRQALQMRSEKEVAETFKDLIPDTENDKVITSKRGAPIRIVIREDLEK